MRKKARAPHPWPAERVIDAIKRWAVSHDGVPPTSWEWNPSMAQRLGHPEVAIEFYHGDYPHQRTVQDLFGSWGAGLEAAGFTARGVGRPSWRHA